MNKLKVVFLHGLESKIFQNINHVSNKVQYLKDNCELVYAPIIDYKDNSSFIQILESCKKLNPDLIIGSSMGGYFAHKIGALLNVNTLLFNPAFHSRSMEPYIPEQYKNIVNNTNINYTVLGRNDKVINPIQTSLYIETELCSSNFVLYSDYHSHRTPIEIFIKYTKPFLCLNFIV
jgi:predicted esterase YcpF (UPF0227 family)